MDLNEFLKSKLFVRQLLYAVAITIVLIWGAMKMLDLYTHHGKTIEVPDLLGLPATELEESIRGTRLKYFINDSIYAEDAEKGSVYAQDPPPGTQVKKGRTIYLTTIALMPEMVRMPNLTDLSLRQAVSMLVAYGLKPGQLEYRPDIAQNAVLQQRVNQGAIEPGTLIAKGTAIDLVIGQGLGADMIAVPVLLGMSREDALVALHASSLNVGNEFYLDEEEDDNKDDARVYQQTPDPLARKQYLRAGSSVDLYFRSPRLIDFETYLAEQLTVPVPLLFGKTMEEARKLIESLGLVLAEEIFEGDVDEINALVFRQEPDYEEDLMIRVGSEVKIWYRDIASFDLDLLESNEQEDDQ